MQINSKSLPDMKNSLTRIMEKFGYSLGSIIGEGSYSKVRLAESVDNPKKRFAVKIINRHKASKDFVERFLPREIEILAHLKHPNIVKTHRILDVGDNIFIIMELAEGGALLDLIQKEGLLPELKAKCFFRQLLSAVQYLHSCDITHRDLKCENVLLFDKNVVKLSDFGFSRNCRESGKRVLSTTYCGSAAYAAPEILAGIPYNPKMYDIWSLGCILFIMLTATMPFDDSNIPKMIQHQQAKKFRFPPNVEQILSRESKELVRLMLEPDVCKRLVISRIVNHKWLE